jgi:transposase
MSKETVYLGLDVDKEKIAAAALMPGAGSQVVERTVANRPVAVKKYIERLTKEYEVIATYEAGCFGFELYRQLTDLGVACLVAAPGLIPRKPSDRVKTDRRDARTLALALRADQVVGIHIPSRGDEAG